MVFLASALWWTPAPAQNPLAAFPKNYSLAFENNAVAVIRVHYGPHETVGVHDHSNYPTVYVYLSNSGPVRFQHDEKPPFTLTRPPIVQGAFRVSPGRAERHKVENLGDTSSDFLRIELKQVPLGSVPAFHGEAPDSLSDTRNVVEFKAPALQIERIVCAGFASCFAKASPAPSVIVAFTALDGKADTPGTADEQLNAGAVRWLPAFQAMKIKPVAGSLPAHLLRILLPNMGKQ